MDIPTYWGGTLWVANTAGFIKSAFGWRLRFVLSVCLHGSWFLYGRASTHRDYSDVRLKLGSRMSVLR